MKQLKVGDYVKCVIIEKGKNPEPEHGIVVNIHHMDPYPYIVRYHNNVETGLYTASELTVIINDTILSALINDMVEI